MPVFSNYKLITYKMTIGYLIWNVVIIMCNINKETFRKDF